MIVVSVLLILVAVMLLVVGLAGGSSLLLISSIVASLLAAVALVVGARQAANMRRAATAGPDQYDAGAGYGSAVPVAEPVGAAAGTRAGAAAGTRGGSPAAGTWSGAGAETRAGSAGPTDSRPRVASRDDAEAALAADAAFREGSEPADADLYPDAGPHPDADLRPDDVPPADAGVRAGDDSGGVRSSGAPRQQADPDYSRASSFIGGARSENPDENAWRRGHADDRIESDEALRPEGRPQADGSQHAGSSERDSFQRDGSERDGFQRDGSPHDSSPRDDSPGRAGGRASFDESGFSYGAGLAEEFGEPDEDDPADEPLPQAVRPADAVRVARMNAEVFVVDGRPRYHLADCPHLVGKLTEPLSAAEAVELGFSPCGLCRPVDRLVAQAAHH